MSLKANKKDKKRLCSKCLDPGHTKRTCTQENPSPILR